MKEMKMINEISEKFPRKQNQGEKESCSSLSLSLCYVLG